MNIRPFRIGDQPDVIDLWHRCGLVRPQNDAQKDIARKLATQPELFLVADVEGVIVGTVMAGYEGHRGWINYLATAPNIGVRGLRRALMAEAELLLKASGCPKINLQVRAANTEVIGFYRAIGFAVDDVVSMGKRLIQD